MVDIGDSRRFRDRQSWRRWLEKNHERKSELWLIFVKKHVRLARVTYEEAVEEALCFGWIDGILKRIDDREHTVRFTPRRPGSVWSAVNKKRARRLIREGRMTARGLAAIRAGKESGQWQAADRRADNERIPADLARTLARNKRAQAFFAELAPSHRRIYIAWIRAAKRQETRARRIHETVKRAAVGKKPGMQ